MCSSATAEEVALALDLAEPAEASLAERRGHPFLPSIAAEVEIGAAAGVRRDGALDTADGRRSPRHLAGSGA
jgi:hypothetical protein